MNKISHIKDNYMSNPSKVLTLANIISLLRAASAIPIIYTLNYKANLIQNLSFRQKTNLNSNKVS